MKIAIIYSTTNKSTKKSCRMVSEKIRADTQLIPIKMAKKDCLLNYDFIILASSNNRGKVQGEMKRYISTNLKTLKGKPTALILNCDENRDTEDVLNKTFTEELVNTSYTSANFGYELDENNFMEKRKINKLIKNDEKLPALNLNEINRFIDEINTMINKRVD
ncbi:flavodoxin domain-containing protein [Methanobrevibacter sp.]